MIFGDEDEAVRSYVEKLLNFVGFELDCVVGEVDGSRVLVEGVDFQVFLTF